MENTPMALAIIELQKNLKNTEIDAKKVAILDALVILKNLLPKEQEAIELAFDMGNDDANDGLAYMQGEDYFAAIYEKIEV